jgi:hypothetical protein
LSSGVCANLKDLRLEEAKKADRWQSAKALLIPVCLFLSCVINAAGVFLVYNNEPLGWIFVFASLSAIIACFVGLIRFQNRYRARGFISDGVEEDQSLRPEIDSDLKGITGK